MATAYTGPSLPNDDTNDASFSFRNKIAPLSAGGAQIRVTIMAPTGNQCNFNNASVAIIGASTFPDCDATPTELLFSGASGSTILAGTSVTSDWLAFPVTTSDELVVTVDRNSSFGGMAFSADQGVQKAAFKAATASYAASTVAGFTSSNSIYGIVSVEVRTLYSLTAAVGTFVLSGIDAIVTLGKGLVAETGAYVLSGVAALLTSARSMAAAVGALSLTGNASYQKISMAASGGVYVLTGIAALFNIAVSLAAQAGSYALTGISAGVYKALRMSMATGSYTLTGIDAILYKGLGLAAVTGSYIVTGNKIIIARGVASAGKFVLRRAKFVLQKLRTTDPTLGD